MVVVPQVIVRPNRLQFWLECMSLPVRLELRSFAPLASHIHHWKLGLCGRVELPLLPSVLLERTLSPRSAGFRHGARFGPASLTRCQVSRPGAVAGLGGAGPY